MKIDKYLISKILAIITGTSTVILFILSQVKALSASESEMKVFTIIYLSNIVILIPSLLFYIWQNSMRKAKMENLDEITVIEAAYFAVSVKLQLENLLSED